MSQHDGVIDNAAGATVRADINNLAAALLSQNSGTSAPSTTYANMPWVDTTNHLKMERNEANTAWIIRGRTDAEGLATKSSGFTVALRDYGKTFYCTAALTVAFTAAATLTDGFWCRVINASTGTVVLDPNSTEQINGANTLDMRPGESAHVETNATLFRALLSGPGLVARKSFGLAGAISPAQLAANTDNWAPTGIEDCNVIRFSTDASRNITGLTQGWDGRVIILENVGAQDAVLVHDATSTAANRFYCPNSTNYTLKANAAVALRYDGTSSRWRVKDNVVASGTTITAGTALVVDPYVDSTVTTQAHGLGAVPKHVNATAECKTAEHGYSIGDKIDLTGSFLDSTGRGFGVFKDATNLILMTSTQMGYTNKSTAALVTLTSAKWKLTLTPYNWT